MSPRSRPALRAAALTVLALLGACGESPMESLFTVPEVEPSAAEAPPVAVPAAEDGLGGEVPIPIPPNNGVNRFGSQPHVPIVEVPRGFFVVVRVTGTVTTEQSDSPCGAGGPVGTWGPWGTNPKQEFAVDGRFAGPGSMQVDQATRFSGEKIYRKWAYGGGRVELGRSGGGSTCAINVGSDNHQSFAGLNMSGSQVAAYEAYPVAKVSASTSLTLPSFPVLFEAESHWELTRQEWLFQPGDTTDAPQGGRWGRLACSETMSCDYVPPRSGRMYLHGRIHGIPVEVTGPIVYVRDDLPDWCEAPTDPPATTSGPGEASLKMEGLPKARFVCDPDEPPEEQLAVEVSCRDAETGESTIERGRKAVCEAVVTPESIPLEEVEFAWTFTPDPPIEELGDVADFQPVEEKGLGLNPWEGPAAQSGTVKVEVSYQDEAESDEAPFRVQPRDWAGALPYPSEAPEVLVTHMDPDRPTERVLEPLPVEGRSPEDQEWPDGHSGKYELRGRSGLLQPVSTGPNRGYHFGTFVGGRDGGTLPGWRSPRIYISPQLEPGSAFYDLQRPGKVNRNVVHGGKSYCSRRQIDELRAEVLRHEERHHEVTVEFLEDNDLGLRIERAVVYLQLAEDQAYYRRLGELRGEVFE